MIRDLNINDFDSLLITGASDAKTAVENPKVLEFISRFNEANLIIGAILIAPMFLLKLGALNGKPLLIGVEKEHLYEEGFTEKELAHVGGLERGM